MCADAWFGFWIVSMRRLDRILLGKIASTDECEAQALPSYDSIRSEAVDLPQMAATCDPCKLIHEELATAVQDPTKIFPAGASPMPVESVKANQRDEYVRVVVRELNCGKLRLTSKAHGLGGVFGVAKANGRQRKIWNGSVLSGLAAEPPKPYRLASPSSFLDVEIQPGERIYFSKRDASTFFDSLRVPEQLRTWFGQPPVTVEELLDAGLSFEHILDYKDGEDSLARRSVFFPVHTVWPMGFSWSSAVAQNTTVATCAAAGIDLFRPLMMKSALWPPMTQSSCTRRLAKVPTRCQSLTRLSTSAE